MDNKQNQRNNSGVLFKSDKIENERSPQYKGNITVDGKDYWISAWVKEGKSGKFMGLAVSPKEEYQPKQTPKKVSFDESDLPF
jgi:hypothetical protein